MSDRASQGSVGSTSDSTEQDTGTSSSANPTPTGETSSPPAGPESPSTTTFEESDGSLTPWLPQRQRIHDAEGTHPTLQGGKTGERGFNIPNVLISAESVAQNQRGELRLMDVAAQLTGGGGKPGEGYPCVLISEAVNLRGREEGARPELDELASMRAADGGSSRSYVLTSSAEDSPAKTSLSPDAEQGSPGNAPASSTSSPESLSLFDPAGYSSRTYPDSSPRTAVGTSESCLERWPTSGTAWDGGFSTHVSSECRSADGACSSSEPSLTEILEPPQNVPARYSLSAKAAAGILRRADKRDRTLPTHLRTALETVRDQDETGRTP